MLVWQLDIHAVHTIEHTWQHDQYGYDRQAFHGTV